MKPRHFSALFLLCGLPLTAQVATPTPAATEAAPATQMHTSELGFAYGIPANWEVVDAAPMVPALRQQAAKDAKSEGERKGADCVNVALTARHGDPASVIVVITLPFDCFGQTLTDNDLPGFGLGVATGMKKSFTMTDPVYGAYTLGAHSVWIERAAGVSIDHPEFKRTLETVCALLKKGAVCWMSMAADEDATRTFEHGAVTLDNDAPVALVPGDVFQKKP